jgi:hypothetical protein
MFGPRRRWPAFWCVAITAFLVGGQPTQALASCGWKVVTSAATDGGGLLAVAAVSPSNVWAVGAFTHHGGPGLVEHWNGSSWAVTPTPADGLDQASLTGVAAIPGTDRMWAVGAAYGRPDGDPDPLVERWTGSRWRLVATPPLAHGGQLTGVVAFSSHDAWAVGAYFAQIGSTPKTLTEHWDGSAWSVVPSPAPLTDSVFDAVTGVSGHDVWAVGEAQKDENSPTKTLTAHWNGARWHLISNPGSQPSGYHLLVAAAAVSSDDVWAAGGGLVMRWDGSAWKVVDPGVSGGFLFGMTGVPSGDVWAVGFTGGVDTQTALIEHWRGARWSATTGPPLPIPQLLAASADSVHDVWAVGNAGGRPLVERRSC